MFCGDEYDADGGAGGLYGFDEVAACFIPVEEDENSSAELGGIVDDLCAQFLEGVGVLRLQAGQDVQYVLQVGQTAAALKAVDVFADGK